MSEEKPKQSTPKNFQEEVAEAIAKGDLAAFKKCCVGKNDINRRLLPHKELKPVPKYNPDQRYINIKGPTMLMYAILCEQDPIVEYILENKNPNVSVKVEGYNCLHLAAMVKDPKCLKLLLQHDWIQENIDEPIDLLGTNAKENEKTTALHAAVSNRRIANAILLLDQFPRARWSQKKDKKPKDKEVTPETPSEQPAEEKKDEVEEEEEIPERNPASINQKSSSGATPLYIAVFLHDYKMVRILLSCEADPSIQCAKEKTPLQLAEEIKNLNDEKKAKQSSQQTSQKKKSKPEIDEIDQIVTALQNAETEEKPDTLDVLKKELAPELIEKKEEHSSNSSDEEEKDEDEENPAEGGEAKPSEAKPEKEKKKSKQQFSGQEKILSQIFDQLKQLNARLTSIENERRVPYPTQPAPISSDVTQDAVCSNCGASGAKQCPQCHKYYCDLCYRKQTVHKCTV